MAAFQDSSIVQINSFVESFAADGATEMVLRVDNRRVMPRRFFLAGELSCILAPQLIDGSEGIARI